MQYFVTIIIFLAGFCVKAQSDSSVTKRAPEVFSRVETMPNYPGGAGAMMKFIQKSIIYPKQAQKDKVSGTSYVKFVVEPDGKISGTGIAQSSGDNSLDDEALRVVSSMPKWSPGYQSGKAVAVLMHLPIKFQAK